jgi:hypothetical protein
MIHTVTKESCRVVTAAFSTPLQLEILKGSKGTCIFNVIDTALVAIDTISIDGSSSTVRDLITRDVIPISR